MVLAAEELEQLKQKLMNLEVFLEEYTKNISLPIKETIKVDWSAVKALVKKLEETPTPPKIEEKFEEPKSEPVKLPYKTKK